MHNTFALQIEKQMKNALILSFGLSAVLFTSCTKDPVEPALNTPEVKVPYTSLSATTNYFETFKGADGKTSVDFSGQTTRINMLKEIDAYMRKWSTQALDAAVLNNMFENKNSPFADAALNSATDKTIVSKTAGSFATADAEAERQRFRGYFTSLAKASNSRTTEAKEGTAGKLGTYLVDEKGFEYGQFIQKGLMGAMMLDQISNVYLGTEKQNADNSKTVDGKNYTQLEHHWDEAYGYLTQNETYPKKDPNDATKWLESYLGTYVRQVGSPNGDPAQVYMAFLKGRAAIVNNDAATRTEQIAYLRTSLEKAVAVIAVSYLNKTKTATTDAAKFHSLSEGVGFIYALRFGYNAKINKAKSDQLLNTLMSKPNGFWGLSNTELDNVRNEIATAFGFDANTVVNH
ncbi:MAG: DUF4856 domain-containing protein [Sphingobacteriales bacterium]|nr:MAG: DUF4856 domain-containing protein [Sphingobacteriales bacterium]